MEKYERDAKAAGRESWYLSWALDTDKEERSKACFIPPCRRFECIRLTILFRVKL